MDCDFSQEIVKKIDIIFAHIGKSGNQNMIQKIGEKKDQIYASIPKSSNPILLNNQIRDFITQYIDNFIKYVSGQGNLQQQGILRLIRYSEKTKIQNIFIEKFNKLPKYFKSLESQDLSVSAFINDQDLVYCKVPFNFTANSHKLDSEKDYMVCITLIFNDICDEEVFSHSLNGSKLIKKIPELNQFEFLQTLKNYLSITVQQKKQIVSLQTMNPIVHFSPKTKDNQNNQQQFYLMKEMEIILSPTYKIKVINIFTKQSVVLNNNYISKNEKRQYDDKLLIQNATNYITLQPLEQNIDHEPITIYDLTKSLMINNIFKLPNGISAQITFDGVGFQFEILKENSNFYTSLQFQGDVHSMTKQIHFSLVIRNELRIQLDQGNEQLFFDQKAYKSSLFE